MKRLVLAFSFLVFMVLAAQPLYAQSPGPSADRLLQKFYAKQGKALPKTTYNYMMDFVTNAYNQGWKSIVVLTNYDEMVRNHIQGYVVPYGANPGDELEVDVWLNPYEVRYIDLGTLGLGDENGWAFFTSSIADFGCGVFVYNATMLEGMTWIKPWYWTTN